MLTNDWKKKLGTALIVAALSLVDVASTASAKTPTRTIVLVHGSFADGSSWDRVVPLLEAKGYNVVAVHEPLTSVADDVAATRRAISEAPGEVILVGHSYGGIIISEAGSDAKVVGLVYVAAFAPDANQSANDLGKGQPAPPWAAQLQVDDGFARLPTQVFAKDFAQDLSAAETSLLAVKQGPIATKAFDEKVKTASWHTKPSWYVLTANDHMVDPHAQAVMARRIKATVVSVDSSHVAMLSKPRQVANVILDAAAHATVASR